ncbi:MAG: sodium:solute symporter [Bythopirellula sp.]|nr:sodium:solute symporter [Bythopirellula sp.]
MLPTLDLLVLVAYLAAVVGIGAWFALRRTGADDFMAASQSLPGWAVGLSMFGSYVSSISFLANPGKAYAGNWNAFVFSLATPVAAAIAVRYFVPFYRHTGEISAYEHLEHRFGPWARTYAVICFLLTQMARTGTVIYLLALAVAPLTGWEVSTTIIVTGVLMTLYTMAGGIKAVVWTGVLQSAVLIAGTSLCVLAVIGQTPGGLSEILETGWRNDKFSLGSFGTSLREPTFWVVFAYGLVINLGNFGTDQSYIQRYLTARSDREAVKSIWITTLLYVPTAAVFFFIGTSLSVLYGAQPELLGSVEQADKVFPHFIKNQLPVGLAGLVVAAIFAASMDSNLNSMATLTLCDLYKRYLRPEAGERESMRVLYISTLFWGAMGTGIGLWMIRAGLALDAWWQLAGIFAGGVLGLFLLGLVSRRSDNAAGAIAVIVGLLVILWMSVPQFPQWVTIPAEFRNPWHSYMTVVVGTLVIFWVGLGISALRKSA